MNHLTMAWERVNAAVGLTEVLDAAHAAFMTALSVIEDAQDPRNPLFVTFVMAGATAATGRLALTAAPSLPDSSRSVAITKSEPSCGMADEDLADLSRLCQEIARRLYDAALTARDAADRAACSKASYHARELCSWFGGLRSG